MATWSEQIFSNEAHDVYDVHYDDDRITTTVTADPATVTNWISQVEWIHRRRLHNLVIGLDVEWRPNVHRNQYNPVALLQLCVGRRCLIFQFLHAPGVPRSLLAFLGRPHYTFVGIGIEHDVERLEEDHSVRVARWEDLGVLADECLGRDGGLRRVGLRSLAREVLGRDVVKPRQITLSRWDSEWLSAKQIEYACVDAFVSFEIGRHLKSTYL
ncbi:hypothetical protein Scep_008842 [Stephania cephalantha]|uniref:3'-5' exonuclease domain-containing protein n=1 Tax=Stephania cephalantha TaxID=152367 RepID=A0AAP0JRY8_9MAGN